MNYETESSLENISQNLTEVIADFLDCESVRLNEIMGHLEDPKTREESVLHIEMATAAMEVYKKNMNYPIY